MMLLVDLGNSRLKWARADAGGLEVGAPIAHGDPDWPLTLARAWAGLPPPRVVWCAAVARDALVAAVAEVARSAFPAARIERVQTPRAALGIETSYDEPARLGIDRFLALAAAWRRGAAPALVVGAGTAVTLDALDRDGRHLGGWIAPSPRLMCDAVLGGTGRVAWRATARVVEFATTTEDGLESGCWHAVAALVDRAWRRLAQRLGAVPRLLLTGGDAAQLAPLLETANEQAVDLVLEGLWHLARANDPRAG